MGKKADIELINRLNEQKATKVEVLETHDLIESLNLRVKHISVMQSELADLLKPIKNNIGQFDEKTKKEFQTKVENI